MNKSKIEWCDYTWNPITGCLHGCEYCYARRIANRFKGDLYQNKVYATQNCELELNSSAGHGFYKNHSINKPVKGKGGRTIPYPFGFEPTFHKYRLDEPERKAKGAKIFVCSMADLFGEWVPDEWIDEIIKIAARNPRHRFLFLTKNPKRYMELAGKGMLPAIENAWFGSTITTPDDKFWWSHAHNTFVSIEPILADFGSIGNKTVKKVDWVIIGAMTGPGAKDHKPKKEWIQNIVKDCINTNTPLFMKNNIIPYWGNKIIQEWPKELEGLDE